MANDCLITKLKGVVNNDNLLKLGEMMFNVSTTSNPSMGFSVKSPITVTALDDGQIRLIDEPDSAFRTAVDINVVYPTGTNIVFSPGTYRVKISDKYALHSLIAYGSSSNTRFDVDISALGYSNDLWILLANDTMHNTGSLSNLKNLSMGQLRLRGDAITGDISDIINMPEIYFINLADCPNVTVRDMSQVYAKTTLKNILLGDFVFDITQFISAQVAGGRTSMTDDCEVYVNSLSGGYLSINNNRIDEWHAYLKWTSASKWEAYVNSWSSSAAAPKLYAKGATAEEIAAWEQAGKTVIVVS